MDPDAPTAPQFKDRSAGLLIFGILQIALGCLCGLLVPFMFLGQAMSAAAGGGPASYRMAIPGALMYAVMAAALIALGIGSIKMRRWARALTLVLAWTWLVIGVIAMAIMAVILPQILNVPPPGGQPLPEAAKVVVVVIALVTLTVIYVLLPGVLVLFYQSKHVKATCEAHHPEPCWTDACPLPVLGLSIWLGLSALSLLMMPVFYNGIAFCFGTLLTGLPGTLFGLCLSGVWAWLAWATYRLRPGAWWITLVVLVLLGVSYFLTLRNVDLMEMYRLMGMPEQQLAQMERYGFIKDTMSWWVLAFVVPFIGYLLWVKRYFDRAA